MTVFCFCLPLKVGCLLGAAIFVLLATAKMSLLLVYPYDEEVLAIILFNIFLQFIGNFMLLLGVFKEDRVCVITFLCFNIVAMFIQCVGLLIWYFVDKTEELPSSVAIVLAVEYLSSICMVRLGLLEYREVRTHHLYVVDSYSTTAFPVRTPMPHSVIVPALGFL